MDISWGTQDATIQGSIALTPGIDPDVFSIEIAVGVLIEQDADLSFDDGETTITIPGCRGNTAGLVHNPQARSTRFTALDWRWKWKQSNPITGEFNRRDERHNLVGTQKTAQELASLCLEDLEMPGTFDVSAMSETDYPYVNWEFADPAIELHKLAKQFSMLICPLSGGNVKLFKIGISASPTLPVIDPIQTEEHEQVINIPNSIWFVGSRNIHQLTDTNALALEAVGFDPDSGEYKLLTAAGALPYRPTDGWYQGFEEDIFQANYKRAAIDSVFKAYRLPASINLQGALMFPGITLSRVEAARRWEENLVEVEFTDNNEERRKEPFVTGTHFTKEKLSDPFTFELDFVEVPFTIDRRRGIILFQDQVFDEGTDADEGFLVGAPLKLVAAFRGDIFGIEFFNPAGEEALFDTVRSAGVSFQLIGSAIQNRDQTFTDAQKHVDAWAAQYDTNLLTAKTIIYPGIVEIYPDGWIEQVSWSLDISRGPVTTISLGTQHDLNTPDRKVRDKEIELAKVVVQTRDIDRSDLNREDVPGLLLFLARLGG